LTKITYTGQNEHFLQNCEILKINIFHDVAQFTDAASYNVYHGCSRSNEWGDQWQLQLL